MKLVNIEGMPNFEVKTADGKEYVLLPFKHLYDIPTVPAIPLDKIKQAREQIIDEKDFAYADFERYKVEYLGQDWEDAYDSLPQDDFRFGMERCLEIIDKLISESDTEKRKPCINYEDGCEEWAGCPCVHYKSESEE